MPLPDDAVIQLPGVSPSTVTTRSRYYDDSAERLCAVQIDSGYVAAFSEDSPTALNAMLAVNKPDAVLLYDHGESDVRACYKMASMLENVPVVVVATRRPLCASWLALGANAVVVSNRREFNNGTASLRASYIVTGDSQGAFVRQLAGSVEQRVPTPYVSNPFVVGAGDAFAAALTVALTDQHKRTATRDLAEAARLACLGASIYVQEARRHVPRIHYLQDISDRTAEALVESPGNAVFADRGFDLLPGCFDCLHDGHKRLFSEAAANRRQLLVAVNTDDSVRALKGSTRPIRPLADRMLDIAHWATMTRLSSILVTSFDGDTPSLLSQLPELPQHIVKGDQYRGVSVPGSDICPVKLLPMFGDFSTTNMQAQR